MDHATSLLSTMQDMSLPDAQELHHTVPRLLGFKDYGDFRHYILTPVDMSLIPTRDLITNCIKATVSDANYEDIKGRASEVQGKIMNAKDETFFLQTIKIEPIDIPELPSLISPEVSDYEVNESDLPILPEFVPTDAVKRVMDAHAANTLPDFIATEKQTFEEAIAHINSFKAALHTSLTKMLEMYMVKKNEEENVSKIIESMGDQHMSMIAEFRESLLKYMVDYKLEFFTLMLAIVMSIKNENLRGIVFPAYMKIFRHVPEVTRIDHWNHFMQLKTKPGPIVYPMLIMMAIC